MKKTSQQNFITSKQTVKQAHMFKITVIYMSEMVLVHCRFSHKLEIFFTYVLHWVKKKPADVMT